MKKITTLLAIILCLAGFAAAATGPRTNVDVQLIKTEPVPLQTSEYADVWVEVTNTGSSNANNVVVEFRETFPFSADADEKTRWELGTVVPGEEYQLHLQVRVDENAVSGNNSLRFDVLADGGVTIQEEVDVEVRTDDAALVIDSIDFPAKVGPGTSNSMDMTLTNLADSYLKNIDVKLDVSDDSLPLATADTNRKRIQKIAPGESQEISFDVSVDGDAENGVYKLPISLEYENEAGTEFTVEEYTGVVVGGSSQLDVGIHESDIRVAGSSGAVTFRIVNRGEGSARFVSMELQESSDYEILSPNEVYLGDMDPDDFQTAEFDVFMEGGMENVEFPVELEYRDSDGLSRIEARNVSMRLYSEAELSRYNPGGAPVMGYLVVVILLAGVGWWYWRRRRG